MNTYITTALTKKQTTFKRFLKELGLYNAWKTARLDYIQVCGDDFWEPVDYYNHVEDIIEASFNWAETGNHRIWSNLYEWALAEELNLSDLYDRKNSIKVLERIKTDFNDYVKTWDLQ